MKTRIRQLREGRDWTVEHLAEVAGVSKGFLSQIETEKREPGAKTLLKIAEAFDCHVSQLLADPDLSADLAEAMRLLEAIPAADRPAALRAMSGFVPADSK